MPGSEPLPVPTRHYRPAAVLAIDLVKHSQRPDTAAIQRVVEQSLQRTLSSLALTGYHFNHTGDGYICTLFGDDSGRIVDFINAALPELKRVLAAFSQPFRAGIDFGLVHFAKNSLTSGDTHFDRPGIRACRLEQAAQPGQVLCTALVRDIFHVHHPLNFSSQPSVIHTKDADLECYEVAPSLVPQREIQNYLSDIIFRRNRGPFPGGGSRRKALLVDDVIGVTEVLRQHISQVFPHLEVITAPSAADAIRSFAPGQFSFVLTDIVLGDIGGVELTERLIAEDPDLVVIGVTGFYSADAAIRFLNAGGVNIFPKPFSPDEVLNAIAGASNSQNAAAVRRMISESCQDPAMLWLCLDSVASSLADILRDSGQAAPLIYGMLRHKAKGLVADHLSRVSPGIDLLPGLDILNTELITLRRLARAVGVVEVTKLVSFLDGLVRDLREMHPRITFELEHLLANQNHELSSERMGVFVLAVTEMVDNAIAVLPEGGTIWIKASFLTTSGAVQVAVTDNGPGVAKEVAERLFEEGVSTKGPGRGLGLYLIQQAVQRLDGVIELESRQGTTARVRLPLQSSSRPPLHAGRFTNRVGSGRA